MVSWLRLQGKEAFVDAATGDLRITNEQEHRLGATDVPKASAALTEIGGPTEEGTRPWA